MFKEDFFKVGGHDKLFAPQSKEDSDLFNRFQLNGYKFIQPWDALVYHFTSRGSRFNKYSGGSAGKNSNEWLKTTTKNGRNFLRKWGHFVMHDQYMKPIIPSKYDIGFIVKNCDNDMLALLEPYCDTIYVDCDYSEYVKQEQENTLINLSTRVLPYDNEKQNSILIEVDRKEFNEQDMIIIQKLSQILDDSGKVGEFKLNNLFINIIKYEKINHRIYA